MIDDIYLTIEGTSNGFYKEKGSKFLSFAYPVETELQIKEIMEKLKKEYHDARHHCYAFILGVGSTYFRANDAGEPTHAAGDPILGQIRSKGLTNTLVVVVRYFGGTKLGIPGLVNAYKSAASGALDRANVVEKVVRKPINILFDYVKMNEVMRLIREYDIETVHQEFTIDCRMELRVRKSQVEEAKEKLRAIRVKVIK